MRRLEIQGQFMLHWEKTTYILISFIKSTILPQNTELYNHRAPRLVPKARVGVGGRQALKSSEAASPSPLLPKKPSSKEKINKYMLGINKMNLYKESLNVLGNWVFCL